jgi:hypothetical protein
MAQTLQRLFQRFEFMGRRDKPGGDEYYMDPQAQPDSRVLVTAMTDYLKTSP